MKLIFKISFFLFLISCNENKNQPIEFSHQVNHKKDSNFYSFIIKNKSNKNLLIFVPNVYLKKVGCDESYLIHSMPVEYESENSFFCDGPIPDSTRYKPLFNVSGAIWNNDTTLVSRLLEKTNQSLHNEFSVFCKPTSLDYPYLLFLKANSDIKYDYFISKILLKGEYTIYYDLPENIINSKKYKIWIDELTKIKEVDSYFFFQVNNKRENGIKITIR